MTRRSTTIFATALLGLTVGFTGIASAAPVIIRNATVYTMTGDQPLEGADVLIEDGKISAVSTDDLAAEGATEIDGTGKIVTPGFMTAHSALGLTEVSAVGPTRDDRSDSEARFSASIDVAPAINPASTLIPVTRIEGVTRAVAAPVPSSSAFGGQGAVLHLGAGPDLVVKARAAQYFALGARGPNLAGGSRPQVIAFLDEALRQADDRKPGTWRFSPPRGEGAPLMTERDLEALNRVSAGSVPLVVYANRAADIRAVLKIAVRRKLKVILAGAAEAWMVAAEIAEADALDGVSVSAILLPTDNLPASFEALGARLDNAARLDAAGVRIAFSSFDTHQERLIPQHAGLAVANGLDYGAALEALTVNPATMFGIETSYGTLAAGMDADVVVWDGDPLEVTAAPEAVFIKGVAIPLTSRQSVLAERYRDLTRGALPIQYR